MLYKLLNSHNRNMHADSAKSSLRSEKVNALISQKPGVIARFALPVIFLLLAALFTAGWFTKYPEVISADAVLLQPSSIQAVTKPQNQPAGYYVQIFLPLSRFKQIKLQQTVQLHFNAYPSAEYGFVTGTLAYIADSLPGKSVIVTAILPYPLITNLGKTIPPKQGLLAQARIPTTPRGLLEKLIQPIQVLKNR